MNKSSRSRVRMLLSLVTISAQFVANSPLLHQAKEEAQRDKVLTTLMDVDESPQASVDRTVLHESRTQDDLHLVAREASAGEAVALAKQADHSTYVAVGMPPGHRMALEKHPKTELADGQVAKHETGVPMEVEQEAAQKIAFEGINVPIVIGEGLSRNAYPTVIRRVSDIPTSHDILRFGGTLETIKTFNPSDLAEYEIHLSESIPTTQNVESNLELLSLNLEGILKLLETKKSNPENLKRPGSTISMASPQEH